MFTEKQEAEREARRQRNVEVRKRAANRSRGRNAAKTKAASKEFKDTRKLKKPGVGGVLEKKSKLLISKEIEDKIIFKPNEGPQTRFLAAPETDVLYGGAAGGGKSYAMLVDPLRYAHKASHRALILRKTMPELRELIDKSRELYPLAFKGARFKEQEKVWRFPSGATLQFGYLDRDADVYRYQGQSYCVEENTPISTPRGGVPIKELKKGDVVYSYEGLSLVTDTFPSYETECVEVELEDGSKHIQPLTHSFLTSLGWQSYASLLGIGSKGFEEKDQESQQHPYVYCSVKQLVRVQDQEVSSTPTSTPVPYKLNEGFGSSNLLSSQPLLQSFLDSQHTLESSLESLGYNALHPLYDGSSYAHDCPQSALNCLKSYLTYRGLYGELLQSVLRNVQEQFPSQDDVVERTPSYHSLDAEGRTLEHTLPDLPNCVYHHPYTDKGRVALYQSSYVACKISYIGVRKVCDITVEGSNNYIIDTTQTIVKNSFIGFDEITHLETEYPWQYLGSRLRTTDPDIEVYLRATANPGGVGHQWVKKRYIDPAPANEGFVGADGLTRKFIPALLKDNPHLYDDGRYQKMLEALDEVSRRRLLEGDWNINEGGAFPEFSRDIHSIQPFEIPQHWYRFKGADYGYTSPSAVVWLAVDPEDNTLILYRELYQKGLTGDELANQILSMEMEEIGNIVGALDTAAWNRTGYTGPTIGQILNQKGCSFRPADKNRVAGKIQLHDRLKISPTTGRPKLLIFNTCKNTIRELESIPLSKTNSEDVDTHTDDHAYDALRYALMSRPREESPEAKLNFIKRSVGFTPSDSTFGY